MKPQSNTEISDKYNELSNIWTKDDKWHWITYQMIRRFISQEVNTHNLFSHIILNAGSAGNNYGLDCNNTIHIDLAGQKIASCKRFIIGSIEDIPLSDNYVDLIICVGSVINYCDPIQVIKEFSRILRPHGYIILEFENSHTLELIGKKQFNKKATLVNTFYNQGKEKIWYFSQGFIYELLKEYNFKLLNIDRCHLLSPLIYRISRNENFSSYFSKADVLIKKIPYLNKFSSNIILSAIKESPSL